ncbi:uncharacterized protein LOC120421055 [Culex pipiens pallens]|uniref:uncharacterized protein LOC120421055 n=1 Tax=Culex pipiens pallens TaxID=42434 RepID=UPI001954BC42|nr:uncharacterized protein LOC120421055 [Culex pipiens pallens]
MDVPTQLEPPLPPEVWERIFRFCAVRELRLVCRRWNDIVAGCPALRQKLTVRFRSVKFGAGYVPSVVPPAANAQLNHCLIRTVDDGWWPDFGRNLTQLSLEECRIAPPVLFRMLRGCPNLREFKLVEVKLLAGEVEAVDFVLDGMEKFSMVDLSCSEDGSEILDSFKLIFPRLKSFSMQDSDDDIWDALFTGRLVQWIETIKETLQVLEVYLDHDLLERLSEVELLQLKQAEYGIDCSSSYWDINLWTKLCRNQPSVWDINLWGSNINDEAIKVLVTNMPTLRMLDAELDSPSQIVPSFLGHLIAVQNVTIGVDSLALAFTASFSPSLTSLTIYEAYLEDGITYLMNSPHLQELSLVQCDLTKCPIPPAVQTFSALKLLELSECKIAKKVLDFTVSCHPALETVLFSGMKSVRIDTVVTLLLLSPKLHRVELLGCERFAGFTSGAEVMRHYHRVHGSADGSRSVSFALV